jgi:uncharacterized OB-fold protein
LPELGANAVAAAADVVSEIGRLARAYEEGPLDRRFTPPYSIAVVELDEGPRMMSNIVDCPQTPEALELDMKLEVAFEKLDDKITLPLFRPAKG